MNFAAANAAEQRLQYRSSILAQLSIDRHARVSRSKLNGLLCGRRGPGLHPSHTDTLLESENALNPRLVDSFALQRRFDGL